MQGEGLQTVKKDSSIEAKKKGEYPIDDLWDRYEYSQFIHLSYILSNSISLLAKIFTVLGTPLEWEFWADKSN